jgi:hypothetical protein
LFRAVDVATDHAYGKRSGTDWTGWDDWTLRMRLFVRHLPLDVQRRLVWVCTEGGLDIAGGRECGWLGPGGPTEERYASQIMAANRRLPPWVRGYALFTALPNEDWRSFEVTGPLWRRLEREIMAMPTEHFPEPTEDWLAELRRYKIPFFPGAALARAILEAGQIPASPEVGREDGTYQWGLDLDAQRWHLWRWTPTGGVEERLDEAVTT